jgi:hypothetical protein
MNSFFFWNPVKKFKLSSKPAVFLEVEEFILLLLLSICISLLVKTFDTD